MEERVFALRLGIFLMCSLFHDCQAEERGRLKEELEEARDIARRRSLGNIKFIGELFKLKMLTEAIMHDCVVKLLKNHDEESLECLCRLLTTIGKDLDFEKAKVGVLGCGRGGQAEVCGAYCPLVNSLLGCHVWATGPQ